MVDQIRAARHLQVETAEGTFLTVGGLARFVERCREIGVPDTATLSAPNRDVLGRYPITFAVTWTEEL